MQAIYAWYCTDYQPATTFEYNLEEFAEEIRDHERQKGDKGDLRLLTGLFYSTIERQDEFDQMIQAKAENWELDRIALLDRILMQMGICEMLNFSEIPIKVTINEYLEIAKKFSTPKSSKFINGILDSLYIELKGSGDIEKTGRGLIEESVPKRGMPGRRPRSDRDDFRGPPRDDNRFGNDRPPSRYDDQPGPERLGPDGPPSERSGSGRRRISRSTPDRGGFDRGGFDRGGFDRDRPPSRFDRPPSDRFDRGDRPPSESGERRKPKLRLKRNSDSAPPVDRDEDLVRDESAEEPRTLFKLPVIDTPQEGTEVPVEQPANEAQAESPTENDPQLSDSGEQSDSEE